MALSHYQCTPGRSKFLHLRSRNTGSPEGFGNIWRNKDDLALVPTLSVGTTFPIWATATLAALDTLAAV